MLKSKLPAFTDLNYKDFRQALQGFTPPSLWGAQLQTPSGAGMERIGGLHQARQLLMDIILLPAKVQMLLCPFQWNTSFPRLKIQHICKKSGLYSLDSSQIDFNIFSVLVKKKKA